MQQEQGRSRVGSDWTKPVGPGRSLSLDVRDDVKLYRLLAQKTASQPGRQLPSLNIPGLCQGLWTQISSHRACAA